MEEYDMHYYNHHKRMFAGCLKVHNLPQIQVVPNLPQIQEDHNYQKKLMNKNIFESMKLLFTHCSSNILI